MYLVHLEPGRMELDEDGAKMEDTVKSNIHKVFMYLDDVDFHLKILNRRHEQKKLKASIITYKDKGEKFGREK